MPYLGTADKIEIVSDEAGFEMHVSTEVGFYIINVHAVAPRLLSEVSEQIGLWLYEGRAARPVTDDDRRHSVHADLYDNREGK